MATPAGSDDSTGQNDAGAQSHNTAVILRCSPFFTASLEGWPRVRLLPSFETPRKRAAPQDDGWMGGSITHVSTIAISCPSATTSSILTSSDVSVPAAGEATGISIFMASIKAMSSPSPTLHPASPGSTQTPPATSVTILISGIPFSEGTVWRTIALANGFQLSRQIA